VETPVENADKRRLTFVKAKVTSVDSTNKVVVASSSPDASLDC